MTDAPTEANPAEASVPAAPCCDRVDAASAKTCALCPNPICRNCRTFVNHKQICSTCLASIQSELAAEKAGVTSIPGAVVGGIIGAVLVAAVWAMIEILSNVEIGYAAIGVGFVAGQGVYIGAGKKKSAQLVVIAIVCSLLGLLLAKYFIVAHVLITKFPDAHLSYVDTRLFKLFPEILPKLLNGFDILWALLAIGAARRVTKPTTLAVSRRAIP